jgi:hypothetical protein
MHHRRALVASIAKATGAERANEVGDVVSHHNRDSAYMGREFGTRAPHNADLRDHYSFVAEIAAVIPVTICRDRGHTGRGNGGYASTSFSRADLLLMVNTEP